MTTLTWETATEWNNAQSENNVVHEAIGDYQADQIQLGYPTSLSNIVSMWLLDENSGTTATDVVGSNDGTYQGSPSLGGTGILSTDTPALDGTDDYVDVPDANSLDLSGAYSVAFWVNFDQTNTAEAMFTKADGNNYVAFFHAVNDGSTGLTSDGSDSGDTFNVGFYDGSWHQITGSTTRQANTWYFVVTTFDGNGTFTLYINGSQDAQSTNFPTSAPTGSGALEIGRYAWNDDRNLQGRVDVPILFNTELSSATVSNMYDAANPSASPNGTLTTGKKTS